MSDPARAWRVSEGAIRVYRLFDVADAIDLARAEALVAAPASRLKLGRTKSSAVEIQRPPLHVVLGRRRLSLASGPREAEASAHLADFGVVGVVHELPIAPGADLADLVPLAEELVSGPTPALDAAARREAEELCAALAPALERPHRWDGLETYLVFFVRRLEEPATAREVLAGAPVARLLLGETNAQRLSAGEVEDVTKHSFSYLEDDLAVVDWNSAFLLEPSGVMDIPDLLEFATAHLLELRYYDALLDRELNALYDEMAEGGATPHVFTRRYVRLQRRTAALLLELSEMIERLENAVKIVGDFYLARVYQGAVRRFRLTAWKESVLRKQKLLAEANQLLKDEADTRRGELLELMVIFLILWEIVLAFVRH